MLFYLSLCLVCLVLHSCSIVLLRQHGVEALKRPRQTPADSFMETVVMTMKIIKTIVNNDDCGDDDDVNVNNTV